MAAKIRPRQGQQFTRKSDGAVFVVTDEHLPISRSALLRYVSGGVNVPKGRRRVPWKRLQRDYTTP